MDVNQIKNLASQKGMDILNSIRGSLGLSNTPPPVSVPTPQPTFTPNAQSFLQSVKPISPAFTPIQQQIQTAGQIPSPAPSITPAIQLPIQKPADRGFLFELGKEKDNFVNGVLGAVKDYINFKQQLGTQTGVGFEQPIGGGEGTINPMAQALELKTLTTGKPEDLAKLQFATSQEKLKGIPKTAEIGLQTTGLISAPLTAFNKAYVQPISQNWALQDRQQKYGIAPTPQELDLADRGLLSRNDIYGTKYNSLPNSFYFGPSDKRTPEQQKQFDENLRYVWNNASDFAVSLIDPLLLAGLAEGTVRGGVPIAKELVKSAPEILASNAGFINFEKLLPEILSGNVKNIEKLTGQKLTDEQISKLSNITDTNEAKALYKELKSFSTIETARKAPEVAPEISKITPEIPVKPVETPGIINLEPTTATFRPARYGRNAEEVANAVNQNLSEVAQRVTPSINLKNIDLAAKEEGTIISKSSQRLYNAVQKELEKNPKLSEEFAILQQQRTAKVGEEIARSGGTVTPELLDALKMPKNYERFTGQQLVALKNKADGLGSAIATRDLKAIEQTLGRSLTQEDIKLINSAKDINAANDVAEELRLTARKMDKTVQNLTRLQDELNKQGQYEARWEEMKKYMTDNKINLNDPNQFADVYRKFFPASINDWLNAVQYNSMLSSPTTFLNNLNIVSTLLQNTAKYTVQGALQQAKERLIKNYKAEYDLGSGVRYAKGYVGQIGNLVKGPLKDYVAEVLGQMKNTKNLMDTPDQIEALRGGIIDTTKGVFARIRNANKNLSKALEGLALPTNIEQEERNIRLAKSGTLLGKAEDVLALPTKALEAADTIVGSIYRAGEKAAFVKPGLTKKGEVSKRAVAFIEKKSVERATRDLFRGDLTEEGAGILSNFIGGLGDLAMKAKSYKSESNDVGAKSIRAVANFMLPFIRVPTNWLKIGFEYSPLGVINVIGAADKTVPLAKAITGLPISLFIAQKYLMGELTTGMPTDKKTRDYWDQNGIKPWSIKIGDTWYDYTKFAPGFSVTAGTIGSILDGCKQKNITQTDAERLLSMSMNIYEYFNTQSFVQNLGLMNNINSGDLTADKLNKLGYNAASRLVPYQGLLRWAARLQDGSIKDPQTFTQYLEQNIPWAKENVPSKTDANGNPLKDNYNIYNSFPVIGRASQQKPGAMEGLKDIEKEKFISQSVSKIQQKIDDVSKQTIKGTPVDINQTQIPAYIKGLNNADPVNYHWLDPVNNKLKTVDLSFMKYQPENQTQLKAFVNKYNQTVQDVTYNPYIPTQDVNNLFNRLNVPDNQRQYPSMQDKQNYYQIKQQEEKQPKVIATPEQQAKNVQFSQLKQTLKQEQPFLKLESKAKLTTRSGKGRFTVPKPKIPGLKSIARKGGRGIKPKLPTAKLAKVKIKKRKPIKIV